jgi:hypothetical protein
MNRNFNNNRKTSSAIVNEILKMGRIVEAEEEEMEVKQPETNIEQPEANTEEPEQNVDSNTECVNLISKLLHSQTQTHIFHLQTNSQSSYAEHKALQKYYEGIDGLVDGLVESYQGKHDILKGYKGGEYKDYTSVDDLISYFKELASELERVHPLMKDTFIQNQIDTISELIYSTLYKLRFLK